MKKSVKIFLLVVLSLLFVFSMMMFSSCSGGGGSSSSSSSSSSGGATTYTGTIYQASQEGGHIGVFPVTIDPSNTTTPITVDTTNQARIQLNGEWNNSNTKTVFHDVKFDDDANPTKIYYSAIVSRPGSTGVTDIGYVDLTNLGTLNTSKNEYGPNAAFNSVIDIDYAGTQNISWALSLMAPEEFGVAFNPASSIEYCASGMDKTNNYYFPMSMSFPSYVDAVPLAKLAAGAQGSVSNELKVNSTDFIRTYVWQIDHAMDNLNPPSNFGQPPLAFIHGGSSPDGSLVYMVTNVVSGLSTTDNLAGVIRTYLVKATDLESDSTTTGTSTMTPEKVISTASFTVAPSDSTTSGDGSLQGTIVYRASFTPDGKYILQSGSDRMIIMQIADPTACYSSPSTTSCQMTEYADTAGIGNSDNSNSVTDPKTTAIASGLGAGTFGGIEVHDVISTPDSKYALLSVRFYSDHTQATFNGPGVPGYKSSGVQLYDINNKQFVGNVVPTCGSSAVKCHEATGDYATRATCGILFHQTN
jgi:hypothetical protein